MTGPSISTLHRLVSAAIWRAERLEDEGRPATLAWTEVWELEEALSRGLPADSVAGGVARAGAVHAAFAAGRSDEALALCRRFLAEPGLPAERASALQDICAEAHARWSQQRRHLSRRTAPDAIADWRQSLTAEGRALQQKVA